MKLVRVEMRKTIYKLILATITLFVFTACNEIKLEEEISDIYSIALGEFKTLDEAESYKSKIDLQLWRELKIVQADQNLFILTYGNFNSSFESGKKAFELYNNSLIDNYKILKNSDYINDLFANVLFVARYQGRPSVYNYNILTKKSKLLWSRWGRKVLAVSYSEDRNTAFIATALGYGKQGSFPYVRDVRLYIYSGEKNQVDEVAELGNGLQLYTYWENNDTFKVNFTKPDSIESELLIQQIYPVDKSGKLHNVRERTFVLTKDGFPRPPDVRLKLFSPSGTFQLRLVNEENRNYVYLRDLKKKAEVMITEFQGKINNVKWTSDEKFLFIITSNKAQNNKNQLLIINALEKNLERNFTGPVYKNLLVQGNLLFFDQQYEGISQITIFDFAAGKFFDEIQIPGGCGINNLFYSE